MSSFLPTNDGSFITISRKRYASELVYKEAKSSRLEPSAGSFAIMAFTIKASQSTIPTSVCQAIKRSSNCAGDSPERCTGFGPVVIMAGSKYTGKLMLLCQNAGKPFAKILPKRSTTKNKPAITAEKPNKRKVFSLRWRFANELLIVCLRFSRNSAACCGSNT